MKKLFSILAGVAIGVALIVTMAVSMFACSSARVASGSSDPVDGIKSDQVDQMLENKLYKVDFTWADPASARSFALNPGDYFISVIGDRVESLLPYLGRVYSIPYGGGEGLHFEAPITNYQMKRGRGGRYEISFEAHTTEDDYSFELEIFPTGESNLTVNSMRLQTISFTGTMDFEPDFEAVRVR